MWTTPPMWTVGNRAPGLAEEAVEEGVAVAEEAPRNHRTYHISFCFAYHIWPRRSLLAVVR